MIIRRSTLTALALTGLLFANACADPTLAPPPASTRVGLFDEVWRTADVSYSMFALKNVNWDSVGQVFRPRAIAATSDAELARVIGDMLLTLHDRHVTLSTGGNAAPVAYQTANDLDAGGFNAARIDLVYLAQPAVYAGSHVRAGVVEPDVGYLRISSFDGTSWMSQVDAALAALDGMRALILDVRDNPGGDSQSAIEVAGRFADKRRAYAYVTMRNGPGHDDFTAPATQYIQPTGSRSFRGPVVLLTNKRVYSAAEDFALAMRQLPNVTIIGDTTAGSSGRPVAHELPNGWTYTISTWIEYDLDQRPIEDAGVAPTVFVRPTRAEASAGSDAVFTTARSMARTRLSGSSQ
jgi:hypothetical protein